MQLSLSCSLPAIDAAVLAHVVIRPRGIIVHQKVEISAHSFIQAAFLGGCHRKQNQDMLAFTYTTFGNVRDSAINIECDVIRRKLRQRPSICTNLTY